MITYYGACPLKKTIFSSFHSYLLPIALHLGMGLVRSPPIHLGVLTDDVILHVYSVLKGLSKESKCNNYSSKVWPVRTLMMLIDDFQLTSRQKASCISGVMSGDSSSMLGSGGHIMKNWWQSCSLKLDKEIWKQWELTWFWGNSQEKQRRHRGSRGSEGVGMAHELGMPN